MVVVRGNAQTHPVLRIPLLEGGFPIPLRLKALPPQNGTFNFPLVVWIGGLELRGGFQFTLNKNQGSNLRTTRSHKWQGPKTPDTSKLNGHSGINTEKQHPAPKLRNPQTYPPNSGSKANPKLIFRAMIQASFPFAFFSETPRGRGCARKTTKGAGRGAAIQLSTGSFTGSCASMCRAPAGHTSAWVGTRAQPKPEKT